MVLVWWRVKLIAFISHDFDMQDSVQELKDKPQNRYMCFIISMLLTVMYLVCLYQKLQKACIILKIQLYCHSEKMLLKLESVKITQNSFSCICVDKLKIYRVKGMEINKESALKAKCQQYYL